jgi:hypothetical protein
MMEMAADRGDFQGAARALQQLNRLGVEVIYRPRLAQQSREVTRGS